jgi:hypothetical protein
MKYLLLIIVFFAGCSSNSNPKSNQILIFHEIEDSNDGSIQSKEINLENFFWTKDISEGSSFSENLQYSIDGMVPQGLDLVIEKKEDRIALIHFKGKAIKNHVNDSSKECIYLSFNKEAFLGSNVKALDKETTSYCLKIQFGQPLTLGGDLLSFSDGIILRETVNNEQIEIEGDSFTFDLKYEKGQLFSIQIEKHPANQCCYFEKSRGVFTDKNINDLKINCSPPQWTNLSDLFDQSSGYFNSNFIYNDPEIIIKKNKYSDLAMVWEGKEIGLPVSEYSSPKASYLSYYNASENSWTHPNFNQRVGNQTMLNINTSEFMTKEEYDVQYISGYIDDNGFSDILWSQYDSLLSESKTMYHRSHYTNDSNINNFTNETFVLQDIEIESILHISNYPYANAIIYKTILGNVTSIRSRTIYKNGHSLDELITSTTDEITDSKVLEHWVSPETPVFLLISYNQNVYSYIFNDDWSMAETISSIDEFEESSFSATKDGFGLLYKLDTDEGQWIELIKWKENFYQNNTIAVYNTGGSIYKNPTNLKLTLSNNGQLSLIYLLQSNEESNLYSVAFSSFDILDNQENFNISLDYPFENLELAKFSNDFATPGLTFHMNEQGKGIIAAYLKLDTEESFTFDDQTISSNIGAKLVYKESEEYIFEPDLKTAPVTLPLFSVLEVDDSHTSESYIRAEVSSEGFAYIIYKSMYQFQEYYHISYKDDEGWHHPENNDFLNFPYDNSGNTYGGIYHASIGNCGQMNFIINSGSNSLQNISYE